RLFVVAIEPRGCDAYRPTSCRALLASPRPLPELSHSSPPPRRPGPPGHGPAAAERLFAIQARTGGRGQEGKRTGVCPERVIVVTCRRHREPRATTERASRTGPSETEGMRGT